MQSLCELHPSPSAHGPQSGPPQSSPVSCPFLVWSLQPAVVGLSVGDTLGLMVGEIDGEIVGEVLGLPLGEMLGLIVGDTDGLIVGAAVAFDGLSVGLVVGYGVSQIFRVTFIMATRSSAVTLTTTFMRPLPQWVGTLHPM